MPGQKADTMISLLADTLSPWSVRGVEAPDSSRSLPVRPVEDPEPLGELVEGSPPFCHPEERRDEGSKTLPSIPFVVSKIPIHRGACPFALSKIPSPSGSEVEGRRILGGALLPSPFTTQNSCAILSSEGQTRRGCPISVPKASRGSRKSVAKRHKMAHFFQMPRLRVEGG